MEPVTHAAADAPRADSGRDMLVFRLGAQRFAAVLGSAEEAVDLPPDAVQAIPGDNPHLLGVFALRGALVPLYTADGILGTRRDGAGTALVVHAPRGDTRAAVAVDDVEDVITVDDGSIRAAMGGGEGDVVLRGVLQRDAGIITIVDLNALVAACRAGDGRERQ